MIKNIAVILSANVTSFAAEMRAAGASVNAFGTQATDVATRTDAASRKTLDTVGKLALGLGVGLLAGFAVSVKAAADFEREMRNVATISAYTRGNFEDVSDQLVRMSRELPQSASTLAKGLYDIASAGFDGAQGMAVLRSSAMAASAGLTTTDVAARGITAALNAYGLSGFEAARISDILFQTVNLGVVTFEQLTEGMGDWVGTAYTAKVPIEDAAAGLATMTLSGISAAEAGTSLNRVLLAFIDPSEAMKSQLKAMGYESGTAALEALGLKGMFDQLRVATGGNVEALQALFPEVRAMRGAFAFMANDGETMARVFAGITDKTAVMGATQRAFNEQSKTFAFQLQLAKNNLEATGIAIGQVLLPALTSLLQFITGLVSGFGALPGPMQTVLVATGLLVTAVALLGGSFLLLAPRIAAAQTAMAGLAATHPALVAGMGLAGRAALGLGIALTVATIWMANKGKETEKAKAMSELFAQAAEAEAQGLRGATDEAIANALAKGDLISKAQKLGVDLNLVAAAARGDAAAMDEMEMAAMRGARGNDNLKGTAFELIEGVEGVAKGVRSGTDQFNQQKTATDALAPSMGQLGANLETVEQRAARVAAELGPVGDALGINTEKVKELDAVQKAYNESMKGFADGASVYKTVLDEKQEKEREARDTLDRATDAGKKAWEDFKVSTDITLGEYNAGLQRQITAAEEWSKNYVAVYQRFGPQVATILASMGEEGRIVAAKMTADLEGEGKKTAELLPRLYGVAGVDATTGLRLGLDPSASNTAAQGQATRDAANQTLGPLPTDLGSIGMQATAALQTQMNPLIPWSTQTGAAVRSEWDNQTEPIVPNTDDRARRLSAALHNHMDPLPGFSDVTARQIASALAIGLDPLEPDTRDRTERAANALRTALAPLPRDSGDQAWRTVEGWLKQLARGEGGTSSQSQAWARALLAVLNPILSGVGAAPVQLDQYARGGVVEDHRAQIARGRWPVRVWAEPETGGEAYIPLAREKRERSTTILEEVARRFGLQVVDLKGGMLGDLPALSRAWGAVDDYGLPFAPTFPEWGRMVGRTGEDADHYTYDAARARAQAAKEEAARRASQGGGLAGSTTGLDPEFLRRFNAWNDSLGNILSITSGFRSRAEQQRLYDLYLAGKGNLAAPPGSSMHERGLAIDHSPSGGRINATAGNFRLHHPVPGESWHVEPMARGGLLSFDAGGWLPPGYTLAHNGTGMPERVISFAQGGEMGQWYGGPGYGFVGPQGELPGPWFAKGTTIPSLAQSPVREIINSLFTVAHAVGSIAAATTVPARQAGPAGSVGGGGVIDNSVTISAPVTVEVNAPVGADVDHLNRIVGTQVNWALKQWGQNLQQLLRAQGRVRIRV